MKSRGWGVASGAVLVGLLLAGLCGCATTGKLALTDARIVPQKAPGGEEIVICVRVIDPQDIIAVVTATVREYPDISLDLNDDGQQGDKVAGDGVWSCAFEIPWGAPAGEYYWDFDAYDGDGTSIKVEGEAGEEENLTAEAVLEIVL